MKVSDRPVTKEDILKALEGRPSAKEFAKLRVADEIFANTLAGGLMAAFKWDRTPQGYDYWRNEYDWLKEQEQP